MRPPATAPELGNLRRETEGHQVCLHALRIRRSVLIGDYSISGTGMRLGSPRPFIVAQVLR
jgi:hypothetical protein